MPPVGTSTLRGGAMVGTCVLLGCYDRYLNWDVKQVVYIKNTRSGWNAKAHDP